ncbi:helix-turn-helix domain-containing protein [Levilactobacillus brevis]|uniref:helix-turn-helix domain-containing protein n=1 Tax=Levilactobacillus brevis TaxID=1580 RepID=UPI001F18AC12|nr:helix-turn-helix domain-containing protein [Levilactobacillus brevis]MCE6014008.1 helix-turn-helix domain-containing protein [Levilactobacillus brevis]MCE6016388.1 helix-turn-helix domain-containing protein [Levilactobacillus brevis]MCE6018797.1 helix-turn-helix domain-containing protein [Levilactobacillus brevis]MCE6021247.1 helix-turn-helix domain-containing protein [Levilactobacillus brevis]MCE6023711.1 helix-turn-helix domain-containing protein [Levilactobacillus brevis]
MGRKGSRYTIEEKLFYIGLVNQSKGPAFIQRVYGIKDDQVRRWGKRYKSQGIDGLQRHPNKKYTNDFKLKRVLEYLNGYTSCPRLCDKYDIPNVGPVIQSVHQYTSGK